MDRILLACKAARYAVDCDGLWAYGNAEVPVYSVNSMWWFFCHCAGIRDLAFVARLVWFAWVCAGIRVL
ncbi:hypothetical protein C2L65_25485 [Paraburkholderia terrae]|uniref:Uncharacterized protein n=1 Tax=Paraburkholderia terrae TaxID=311230 RepID=A0A2I8EU52_9BURK|nr:hypothetical protein C2L65_25485 [Paraburkholderia terrae]